MKKVIARYIRNFVCVNSIFIIIMLFTFYIKHAANDGFYNYVLKKGIDIKKIDEDMYGLWYKKWYCEVDTTVAKNFMRHNISWTDIFETSIEVLSKKTVFSPKQLHHKLGVLPKDGTPVTIVARQDSTNIPDENVIIRLNRHGQLDARTTMVMAWPQPIETIILSARYQPNQEMIHWFHHPTFKEMGSTQDFGLWNTSHPLVIPEEAWGLENLEYYKGPLFFMKGRYNTGNFAKCLLGDDYIGMAALNRLIHLKGSITTLGYSTSADEYNTDKKTRFYNLVHKLVWFYYAVNELSVE